MAADGVERKYVPSPRPAFDEPSLIRAADAHRHIWGDPVSGEVADWIYASTEEIHCLVFGLPRGGAFRHSPEYRTVFGADEVLTVLSGQMALANPESGEVVLAGPGRSVWFGADTWHHAFAHGDEPLRVLEFFAPPPAAGTSGAYARTRPYLEEALYADDRLLGRWPDENPEERTLHLVGEDDILWRRDLGVLAGTLRSSPHLTVSRLEIGAGEAATIHSHGGEEVLFALDGPLHVRAWFGSEACVFELEADDACFLPRGCDHEYRNYGSRLVRAMEAVAPRYR
jgi:mannose-6-phosphate isomerase-like protein (cupin superfamily)